MSEPETMAEFRKLMIVDVSIETYNVEGLMVGHHHVFLVDMSHVGRYIHHVELCRPWYLKY